MTGCPPHTTSTEGSSSVQVWSSSRPSFSCALQPDCMSCINLTLLSRLSSHLLVHRMCKSFVHSGACVTSSSIGTPQHRPPRIGAVVGRARASWTESSRQSRLPQCDGSRIHVSQVAPFRFPSCPFSQSQSRTNVVAWETQEPHPLLLSQLVQGWDEESWYRVPLASTSFVHGE